MCNYGCMYCIIHKDTELVCPTCLAQARGSKGGSARTAKQIAVSARISGGNRAFPWTYTQRDCLDIFEQAPDRAFTKEELIAMAPAAKRFSAKDPQTIPSRLARLHKSGKIEQVSFGHWRLARKRVKGKAKKM